MKQLLRLASGPLGFLGEIHLDQELKGKHYEALAVGDTENMDKIVVGILKDLMDEDPYLLTLPELYHVWLYVKCASLGPKLTVTLECPHEINLEDSSKRVCGASTDFTFSLTDGDILRPAKDFSIPKIKFIYNGEEKEFLVKPPNLKQEIGLIEYFQEKGVSRAHIVDMVSHRKESMNYANARAVLHLLDGEIRPAENYQSLEDLIRSLLEENSVRVYRDLLNTVADVSKYGVKNKTYDVKCKSCGGIMRYTLSLSDGLSLLASE